MKFLIDTNIFLEVVLAQSKATDAQELLSKTEENEFFVSDYSLHSIGLLFFRRKQYDVFQQFLTDMIYVAGIKMVALLPKDMGDVINAARKFGLDFDDAYQYVTAEQYGLTIISFDSDFDRTEIGRKTPDQIKS
jgi:predicted nucleic acid-binding protein